MSTGLTQPIERRQEPVLTHGALTRLAAYSDLGKLKIFELWLGVALAWSLLPSGIATSGQALALLTCALLIEVAMTSSALALDDVTGFRDGLDASNHSDTDRYGVHKPLVAGRLTERQALSFGYAAALCGVIAMLVGLAIAYPVPWWLFAATISVAAAALNYSYGLRLSYWRGGCELVTFGATAATLLLPYALVTGRVSAVAAVESALVGLWMLQIAVFSNTMDAAGDREARRMTIAASSSPRANRIFILAVFGLSSSIAAMGVVVGILPSMCLLLLLVVPLHLRQVHAGLAGHRLPVARSTGFWAFRGGVAVLFAANLVAAGP